MANRINRQWLHHFCFSTQLPESESLLADIIPKPHPLNALALRLDNLERQLERGTDWTVFNLSSCILYTTGVKPTSIQPEVKSRPRPSNFELLAQVVTGYRILDAYLALYDAYPLAPGLVSRQSGNIPDDYHVLEDWPSLVEALISLIEKDAFGGSEIQHSAQGPQFLALAKNQIRAQKHAAISHINSNLYTCAMYLLCMCDAGSIEDPFTMPTIQAYFRSWCDRKADTHGLQLTEEEAGRLAAISQTDKARIAGYAGSRGDDAPVDPQTNAQLSKSFPSGHWSASGDLPGNPEPHSPSEPNTTSATTSTPLPTRASYRLIEKKLAAAVSGQPTSLLPSTSQEPAKRRSKKPSKTPRKSNRKESTDSRRKEKRKDVDEVFLKEVKEDESMVKETLESLLLLPTTPLLNEKVFVPSGNAAPSTGSGKRVLGNRAVSYLDIAGGKHSFTPCMNEDELSAFYAFHDALEASYIDGVPQHIHDITKSCLKHLTQDEFQAATPAQKREWISKYNLVVSDPEAPKASFSLEELDRVEPVDNQIILHDHSLGFGEARHVSGTLRHVYQEHRKGNQGKVVNALDLPRPEAEVAPMDSQVLFSDVKAFRETKNCPMPLITPYPTGKMRWALVGVENASHPWHIDAGGLSTFAKVRVGYKLWYFAVPPDGSEPLVYFSDINVFLKNWDPYSPSNKRWKIFAILLRPGDTLYMRPLMLHAVWTLSSSICYGGHLYCSSTLSLSVASFIQSFHLDKLITNDRHSSLHTLLARQVVNFHNLLVCGEERVSPFNKDRLGIDLLRSFEEWHGFVMLHVLITLGLVVDHRSYRSWTGKPRTESELLMMVYSRGAALATMLFLGSHSNIAINIERKQLNPWEYFTQVLLQQCVLLLRGRAAVESEDDSEDIGGCSVKEPERLRALIQDAVTMRFHRCQTFRCYLDEMLEEEATSDESSACHVIPLPPPNATIIRRSPTMSTRRSPGVITHNAQDLILEGLTPETRDVLAAYIQSCKKEGSLN
ncbi:hypothetical protein D9611_014704 [Ephemerocybe angulata]|uniref:JmjC domain-containing protein n=1 Tax=Ephemerocybe angulata TaxID=980116 RepID=A0A8H5ARS4_9AGAR|nr:hypothetical protein D9611_014704 [Tulosesus angulatus]